MDDEIKQIESEQPRELLCQLFVPAICVAICFLFHRLTKSFAKLKEKKERLENKTKFFKINITQYIYIGEIHFAVDEAGFWGCCLLDHFLFSLGGTHISSLIKL